MSQLTPNNAYDLVICWPMHRHRLLCNLFQVTPEFILLFEGVPEEASFWVLT